MRVYRGISCKKRWHLPIDLRQLMGDNEADDILRCKHRHDKGFLESSSIADCPGTERHMARRVVKVRVVRTVMWVDDD